MKTIYLSTDIGTDVDDALALKIALNHPNIHIGGVYTTNGDLDKRAKIAKYLIELEGRSLVIANGESRGLFCKDRVESYHTGLETLLVPERYKEKSLKELGVIGNGVDDLAQRVQKGDIIASIAPLTNIAQLLKKSPSVAEKINCVYVMGGRTDAPEHNFRHDYPAAKCVLASDLNIIVIPADVCQRYKKPLDSFALGDTPSGNYLKKMLDLWTTFNIWRNYLINNIPARYTTLKDKVEFPRYVQGLIDNLLCDGTFMAKYPSDYINAFKTFLDILDKESDKPWANEISPLAKGIVPQDVAVHDTYVIYAIAHPDHIKMRRGVVEVARSGEILIHEGEKHTIVEDIDVDHFKEFLQQYLK